MATKKKKEKGLVLGSANPRNRAALEAAGMKAKKKTAKKATNSKKAAADKALHKRIDKIRAERRKKAGLKK